MTKPATFSETEVLTPEITALREGVNQGASLFVCGRAGVGKSRQLRWAVDAASAAGKAVACVAPTGVAATNVGGQTIHSFFKFPIGALQEKDARKAVSQAQRDKKRILERLDMLVIDEVSMVRSDLMHAVDVALQTARGSAKPFGGVQVLLFGDVYQLPPILKRSGDDAEGRYIMETFGSSMFFAAKGSQIVRVTELTEVFRQREREFAVALNDIRDGRFTERAVTLLNSRVGERDATAVTLTTTRARAQAINDLELDALVAKGAKGRTFLAKLDGNAKPGDFLAPEELTLCVGARVMTLVNDSDGLYRNGSTGTVVEFVEGAVLVRLDGSDSIVTVEPKSWEKMEYSWDPESENLGKTVAGSMKQYPLNPAWAVTIHKAQGLSLDRVHVDLQTGAFEAGQAYVALSRCRTLGGLTLEREMWRRDVLQHPDAGKFKRVLTGDGFRPGAEVEIEEIQL